MSDKVEPDERVRHFLPPPGGGENKWSARGKRGEKRPGTAAERCRAMTRAGQPCGGARWQDSDFCFWHEPKAEAVRAGSRRRSWQRAKLQQESLPAEVLAESEVRYLDAVEMRALLARTLARLERVPFSPGVAYAMGYLVQLLQTLELAKPAPKPWWKLTPEEKKARQQEMRRRIRAIYGWPDEPEEDEPEEKNTVEGEP